jgi:hypothetical protein
LINPDCSLYVPLSGGIAGGSHIGSNSTDRAVMGCSPSSTSGFSIMNRQIDLNSWSEFDGAVRQVKEQIAKMRQDVLQGISVQPMLYRGQSSLSWRLDTTLERAGAKNFLLVDYYKTCLSTRHELEVFTDRAWDLPEYVHKVFIDYDAGDRELWSGKFPGCHYMAYLRHYGFPSPLLDWSQSPYIAAYFAFRFPLMEGDKAVIYALSETPKGIKVGGADAPRIQRLGPYVKTDRRHFRQQSEYTLCVQFDKIWRFSYHEEVASQNNQDQDILWKITIPANERLAALISLDEHNINEFSLFETEDGLLRTMGMRRFDFRNNK